MDSKFEGGNCPILVSRNFPVSTPLLIIWSNSLIGPIQITGKFLANRGSIDHSSVTNDSFWAEFENVSLRLDSAGKVIN
jgi:hypothetical protein